uniref:Disintegrin domain-containing protein n=1 Tax=Poecilia latipinna TaxID=48699 RepID=A0A3B3VGG8_9TELE
MTGGTIQICSISLCTAERNVFMCYLYQLYLLSKINELLRVSRASRAFKKKNAICGKYECMNPCCNATTCTLKGDAVCAHGHCCQDCQVNCVSDKRNSVKRHKTEYI